MSNFMGVGIFWIGRLNRADLGCWRLTLSTVADMFLTLFQAVLIHVNTLITTSQA